MRIDVVSIFPEYLAALDLSLIGKARQDGLLQLKVHDLRDFTTDRHRTVDDTPYGGGAGMVMKPEPWAQALESLVATPAAGTPAADQVSASERVETQIAPTTPVVDQVSATPVVDQVSASERVETQTAPTPVQPDAARPILIVPSPAGEVFNQALAYELATEDHLVFACGRYEGIDERVLEWAAEHFRVRPVSLGDYVLNGGEVAVLAMVEAVGRLVPGVVGNPESLVEESHSDGLLEYPVYTKPSDWRGRGIPEVLLSGNHAKIARHRRDEQLRRTAERRPDLILALDPETLDTADRATLSTLGYAITPTQVLPATPKSGVAAEATPHTP
ncbi:tRNA (guanosine(37)-N1)-methyltransferase TrmD [Arthrobacter sulfonylureivorans]|uniref:tRNA (guanine-N(1)-)-methyltransferase n=1 Tax=Arthrobacter sulfonylureivorans TaxID=2486855 RepID=A0ABY3WAP4_9MICC|nr:tRNA (guanosine(37)-N1)-methyltransferase TrmD [Arthrobacter sulfonylureivorans]UNK47400.1 tRNA (guanosine(37)-N1)-methyltransferase TrmD [Arthrobacter sulfonylureivorans]